MPRVVAEEPEGDISAACSEVVLAVVLSKVLFSFFEELEITGWDAANPSAFPVLELDELRPALSLSLRTPEGVKARSQRRIRILAPFTPLRPHCP
jgi:hypothetical protein